MIALDSPEDIARWREARRLNWPSKENLKRKIDELQGRQARGELLPAEREAKSSRQKAGSSWQIKTSHTNAGVHCQGVQDSSMSFHTETKMADDSLSSLLAYSSDSSEEKNNDDLESPEIISSRTGKVAIDTMNPTSAANVANEDSRNKKRICKFYANGHCTKGRWCKFLHESVGKTESPKSDNYQYHGSIVRRGPCLLHKLLSSENDREISRILQCLRHLVSARKLE
jgi:hypothetical protein